MCKRADNLQADELTRDSILSGEIIRAAYKTPDMQVWSTEELMNSIHKILAEREKGNFWFFGYGSLIWNPAIVYDAQVSGLLHGWHRSFCLRTSLSRGNPTFPGLILGLDRSGSCQGVAFRIPEQSIEQELLVLWKREMVDGSYVPRWVTVETEHGSIRAVTLTMDPGHSRYVGQLPKEQVVQIIAKAEGRMGRCSDYLFRTVEALESMGIGDQSLKELQIQVGLQMDKNLKSEQAQAANHGLSTSKNSGRTESSLTGDDPL